MRNFICLAILFIVLGITALPAAMHNEKRIPIVVELFTSEGCSTCPPADKYLQILAQEQPIAGVEIIALGEHVDYWNRFGWTDPFSAAQFSRRQANYSIFFKQPEVYTPQMVVDGTLEFVGSRMREGVKQILEAAKNPKADVGLEIEKEVKNTISVKVKIANLPQSNGDEQVTVFLAVTENNLTSQVTRGENSGQTLKHTAVTRYLKDIGSAARNENSNLLTEIKLEKNWQRENLSIIAFIQETNSRRILGAAKISLKN